jgi:hypothetical protein
MAIIELNLEKPALKRVESVEEQRTRSDRTDAGIASGETTGTSGLSSTGTGTETASGETSGTELSSTGTASGELVSDETASGDLSGETTTSESGSGGKSRVRKYGRRMALLGGTAAGVAAARKLRQRRKSGSGQQELEEDWQTAE